MVRRPIARFHILLSIVLTLCAGVAIDARAIRYQPRPTWTVGVGLGVGQGEFENVPGCPFHLFHPQTDNSF